MKITQRILNSVITMAIAASAYVTNMIHVYASDAPGTVENAETTLVQATQTVESAKQAMDDASKELNNANAEVARLTSEKEAAEQKLADANAQLKQARDEYDSLMDKADTITDDDRTNAENAVTEATKAADDAQLEANKASKALDDANTAYNEASTNLANAQNTYNQALAEQQKAQKAVDDAKLAEEKAKIEADNAEAEKNTAQVNADKAAGESKTVEDANPDAEQKASDAKTAVDNAETAQAGAQKDVSDAETAKNAAEGKKNTAQTDVDNASAAVDDATQTVTDKTTDVTNAENAKTVSQTALNDANKTLDDETAKAGDAQKKADQEVKDQQSVVDQAVAKKAEADQALEDAKTEQASKQADLNDANAKLDAAKADQANAEKDLKAKQDKLAEAEKTLENAKGDVTKKKQAVADAQKAVTDAENDLESKTAEVEKLKAESVDQQTALDNARKEVESAQAQVDAANAELKKFEDTTLYQQIYVTGDPDMPVPDESMSIFAPVIPEANGAKVTFTVNKNYDTYYSKADKVCESLNTTGSYTPAKRTVYYYKEDGGWYSGYYTPQEGRKLAYTDVDVDGEGTNKVAHIVANWTDAEGNMHSKQVVLEVEKYNYKWVKNYVKTEAEKIVSEIITDDMTSEQKAKAITDYVVQHYEYNMSSSAYYMLTTGGSDCWGATDLVCALGDAAGFKTTTHWDNYTRGMGKGHMNAWLYSPSDDKYYQCEAGFVRTKDPETGLCGSRDSQGNFIPDEGITFNIPIDEDAVEVDRTPGVYGIEYGTETVVSGAKRINNVIASFYNFDATEIHVPTNPRYDTLGGRRDSYFKDGPFSKFTRLKTVYVGANITTINQNAYAHYEGGNYTNNCKEGWYDNPYKFIVDENNPKYCSDENGNLYEKNADGTRGKLLHTPGLRYQEVTDDKYYENVSKTNAQNASDYESVNKTVTDARNAYTSANTKYDNLMKDDFAKKITDAEDRKQAAQNLLDAAKSSKTIADNALTTANQKVTEAETAKTNAENDVSTATQRVTTAQNAVDEAKKPVATAEQALNDAKTVVSDKQTAVTNAQNAVNEAKKVLADKEEAAKQGAPESLVNARKAVEAAKADLSAKTQTLADARTALKTAQDTLADKKADLNKANDTLDAKKTALENAEKTLADKKTKLEEANNTVKQAQADLEKANTAYKTVLDAKAKSTAAAETLKSAQGKFDKANKALADVKNDLNSKNTALAAVNEKAAKLAADLGIAKDDADAKKLKADNAKTLYEEKTNNLTARKSEQADAQAKLDDLVNTLNRRDELVNQINDLNEKVPEYVRDVEDLDSQLTDAKVNASNAETIYNNAKKTYDTLAAEQKKADEAKAAEEAENYKSGLNVNNYTVIYTEKNEDPAEPSVAAKDVEKNSLPAASTLDGAQHDQNSQVVNNNSITFNGDFNPSKASPKTSDDSFKDQAEQSKIIKHIGNEDIVSDTATVYSLGGAIAVIAAGAGIVVMRKRRSSN